MKQASGSGQGGPARVKITAGTEDDLVAIVGILNYSAADSLVLEPSVHVALAGIAVPNYASVALHRKLGFTEVGTFREYTIKNGQYISSVWTQRMCHPAPPPRQQPENLI